MGSSSMCLSTILSAPGVRGKMVTSLPKDGLINFIESLIIKGQDFNEPFYVLDLGVIESLMDQWTRTLPTVHPFFAVKCNPEPAFLGAMAALGANFDCASRSEIETVLSLGVSPDRIVYANPCKAGSHIKYAASVGVNLTTFDSKFEIDKIRKYHPKCDLLIRIKVPEYGAKCTLGTKFGALPEEVAPLLQAANVAGLNVSGVSFHVGSGGTHSRAFREAIAMAKAVFDAASRLGLPRMRVLNIGGGFTSPLFNDVANVVESAIQKYFGDELALTVIAEPGRFFAESPFTLATNIIGKRVRGDVREYWINDGIYGSMNCVLNHHTTFTLTPFACKSNPTNPRCQGVKKTYLSTVFGPSCDALDTLLTGHWFPELQVNDWLLSPKMGAYTSTGGCNFNGFNLSAISTHLAYSSPI